MFFEKKTLQVHNLWNFFLKDHPYFHAMTFLSVTNVFFSFWSYSIIIQMSKNVNKEDPPERISSHCDFKKRHLCLT